MTAIHDPSRKSFPVMMLHFLSRFVSLRWALPGHLFGWDSSTPLRPTGTSWLDGLRGVASIQVLLFHFFGRYTQYGRTYGASDEDRYLHQLPIARAIWAAGPAAVSVFFVISGYAITVKSIILLRRKNYDDLSKGLSSSLIRRGFRLYSPIFILSIPAFFLIRLFDMNREGYIFPEERKATIVEQFVHWIDWSDKHLNPFAYPETNPSHNRYAYVPPSWTIPMEFNGSMVCYLMVLVISRVEVYRTRLFILGGVALYALHRGSWWNSLFVDGMLIADYVLEQKNTMAEPSASSRFRQIVFYSIFGAAYYVSGIPPQQIAFDANPKLKVGYEFIYNLNPPHWMFQMYEDARWWWYWSGLLIFFSVSQLPRLQAILETRLCQWLGKISFSLYLVHAAIFALLTGPILDMVKPFSDSTGILCFVELTIMFPIIFALSAFVEKHVDQPSVRFAKRVEIYVWSERVAGPEEILLSARQI